MEPLQRNVYQPWTRTELKIRIGLCCVSALAASVALRYLIFPTPGCTWKIGGALATCAVSSLLKYALKQNVQNRYYETVQRFFDTRAT